MNLSEINYIEKILIFINCRISGYILISAHRLKSFRCKYRNL